MCRQVVDSTAKFFTCLNIIIVAMHCNHHLNLSGSFILNKNLKKWVEPICVSTRGRGADQQSVRVHFLRLKNVKNVKIFWLAPVFQSKPQQQFLDWCLTGRNGLARWSQGLWGICVFNLVWYFADGNEMFFTSRQPGRTRHRAKDCPPDKKYEADVEVLVTGISLLASSSSTLWWWPTWYPQIIGTKVGLSGSGPQSVSHVQYLGMMAEMQGTDK